MVQVPPAASGSDAPQLSDSIKLGRLVKSLLASGLHFNGKSVKVAPEVFVRVMVCVVGAVPSVWGEKRRIEGDSVIGC
jgi:hypothetical protein